MGVSCNCNSDQCLRFLPKLSGGGGPIQEGQCGCSKCGSVPYQEVSMAEEVNHLAKVSIFFFFRNNTVQFHRKRSISSIRHVGLAVFRRSPIVAVLRTLGFFLPPMGLACFREKRLF